MTKRELEKGAWGRAVLFVAAGWAGYVLGNLASAHWRLSWVSWNPIALPGVILWSLLMPWGLVVFLATYAIGIAVLMRRLPRWTIVGFLVGNAVLTMWALRSWRV